MSLEKYAPEEYIIEESCDMSIRKRKGRSKKYTNTTFLS